jgi:hypothetical protein
MRIRNGVEDEWSLPVLDSYKSVAKIDSLFRCPKCGANWKGKPIPKKDRHLYAKGSTHFSRLIGIEIPEKFDGVSYWQCPDCHTRWDRWTGIITGGGLKMKVKLTKCDIRCIRNWLEIKRKRRGFFCPFLKYNTQVEVPLCYKEGEICKALFPRLNSYNCPCEQYDVEYVTKRAKKAVLVLIAMIFLSVCGAGCGAAKFGAGVVASSITHQAGHYVGAVASGTDFRWRSMPPVVQIQNDKSEPLAYGGGLLLQTVASELIMSQTAVLTDEKGEKFLTDFWMGFLTGASFDSLNYGVRRSGLFGDHKGRGQNDLSKDDFGQYHKLAGAVSTIEGARIAYKLSKGKRTCAYWTKVKIWTHSIQGGLQMGLSYIF